MFKEIIKNLYNLVLEHSVLELFFIMIKILEIKILILLY